MEQTDIAVIFGIKTLCDLHITESLTVLAGTTLDVRRVFSKESYKGNPTVLAALNGETFYVRGWEYTTDLTLGPDQIFALTAGRIERRIRTAFGEWISTPERERSPEVDCGGWWTLHGDAHEMPRWRVSWIEKTGELYAAAERQDKYIVLAGTAPGDEEHMERLVDGWSDPDSAIYHNLTALWEQIQQRTFC